MMVSETVLEDGGAYPPISLLSRDAACCRDLNWRCEVSQDLRAENIANRFVGLGWQAKCQHPVLAVFRHRDGHEIAWVRSSGRVQIRVSILVERARREEIARMLYKTLCNEVFVTSARRADTTNTARSQGAAR